jgi:hypothetical protein
MSLHRISKSGRSVSPQRAVTNPLWEEREHRGVVRDFWRILHTACNISCLGSGLSYLLWILRKLFCKMEIAFCGGVFGRGHFLAQFW